MNWKLLLTAIGLAFIFEGIPYFLWAEKMSEILLALASQPPGLLRAMGFFSILVGLTLVYFFR